MKNKTSRAHVAIDLGAGSGRVILGILSEERVNKIESVVLPPELRVLHRFANPIEMRDGHERWNLGKLFEGVLEGLARAAKSGVEIQSVGVDTWGVDYGLLDSDGNLLEDPICYRDARTRGVPEKVFAVVPREEVFARTGVQVQPFNTLYQLWAHVHEGRFPARAHRLLFMPDLLHALLCASSCAEATIASTSQMLNVATSDWDTEMLDALGLPTAILPRIERAGTRIGELTEAVRKATGLGTVPVVLPACHDTASAVVGAGLAHGASGEAFLSSGTWSLLGVVTDAPVVNDIVRRANLTNEAGAFGKNRLLQNVMGLWIVEECRRIWGQRGLEVEWENLLPRIAHAPAYAARIPVDDPRFFRPADMVAEILACLRERSVDVQEDPAWIARIVLESLAYRYAEVVRALELATGTKLRTLTIVGGGVRNSLLNQLTADATGLDVLPGPEEATALGNILVQASAFGPLPELRRATYIHRPRDP